MTAQKASGGAAIVSGMIDFVGGGAKMAISEHRGMAALEARKAMGNLRGNEKSSADEITELQQRISDSRTGSGAMKMISGTLQMAGGILAVAGVTSVVGTILSGLSTAVSLAVSVKEFLNAGATERRQSTSI